MRRRDHAGFTLIEAILAVAILSLATAISVGAISSALPQIASADAPVKARELARDLLEEVLSRPADDPDGIEESTPRARGAIDDVDDYDGFSEVGTPRDPSGQPISGASGFNRAAAVLAVATNGPDGPAFADAANAPYLRVAVTVTWPEGTYTLTGLKARERLALPAPRGGLEYVLSSRRDNGSSGNEHMEIRLANRLSKTLTITRMTAFWPEVDAEAMYYREIRLNNSNVADRTPLYAKGDSVFFTPALVLEARTEYTFGMFHFRENQDGTGGPPDDLKPTPLTLTFFTTTGASYQVDIEALLD